MPYKSKAQQRFMHARHPGIAKRWDKETDFSKLPDKKEHRVVIGNTSVEDDCDMDEALNLKQLRDPMGFINGVDQFVQDAKADISTLMHFADTYAHSQKNDPNAKKVGAGVGMSLKGVSKALDMVEKGMEQMRTKDMAAGKSSQGKVLPMPGVKGQPQAQQNPGLLKKLFGMK